MNALLLQSTNQLSDGIEDCSLNSLKLKVNRNNIDKNQASSGICGLTQGPRCELEPTLEKVLKSYGCISGAPCCQMIGSQSSQEVAIMTLL